MDLSHAVTVDPGEAESMIEDYRNLRSPSQEDQTILSALRAASDGRPILRLRDTVADGGTDDKGRPHLAVGWAHWMWCVLRREHDGSIRYAGRPHPNGNEKVFDFKELFTREGRLSSYWSLRSQVPPIPPKYRPAKSALRHYAVLWEVEEWGVVPRPPGDPALLRPLGNDLWVVEATWDLSPLEKLVLSGRGLF